MEILQLLQGLSSRPLVFEIIDNLNAKELIEFNHINEEEYFPLPKELRNNVKIISNFLEHFCIDDEYPQKIKV